MATIGQTITGPRFYETDEVSISVDFLSVTHSFTSGSTDKRRISTVSNPNCEDL